MENLVPKFRYTEAKEIHSGSESWTNYARRITKNPFVKDYLRKRDGNNCQWCQCALIKEPVIHHKDYDHECTFGKTICITHPTQKRLNRTYETPDCERCMEINEKAFNSCMAKIVLVHQFCNREIALEGENC